MFSWILILVGMPLPRAMAGRWSWRQGCRSSSRQGQGYLSWLLWRPGQWQCPLRHIQSYDDLTFSASIDTSVLTLSPTIVGMASDKLQKIALHVVLELCTRCRYQHMRIELLVHVVCLIFCLDVQFVQYRLKKNEAIGLFRLVSTALDIMSHCMLIL